MYPAAAPAKEVKSRRQRHFGITARSARVEEWKYLKKLEIARATPGLSQKDLAELVEKAFEATKSERHSDRELAAFDETAPVSRSPRPSETCAEVEMAAMRGLGTVRWLIEWLLAKTNLRGRRARREMVVAVFLQMALGRGRPEIARSHNQLTGNRPALAWAHDYPTDVARKTLYESLHNLLRQKDPDVLVAANIDLIRQLAEIHNQREWPRKRGGRRKGEALLVGEIGIVDGTLVPAPVQQRHPKDAEHKRILHGEGREMVNAVVYTDANGKPYRFTEGYRLVILADLATTLPIAATLMPASGDEREALLRLLEKLFEAWPECPMSAIVGDGLFQHSQQLSRDLVFKFGLQPIFPKSAKGFRQDLPHAESDGVPRCACGEMRLRDTDGFYTAERRAREGIPRGVEAPDPTKARLRWTCLNDICKPVTTYAHKEPRLYTFYPRGGDSERAIERRVLMLRRNAVESIFACFQNLGLGREKFDCPRWAKDVEMGWLLGAGMLGLTARRLAHDKGLYETTYAEAEGLGLLDQPTESCPAPGPDELTLARARRDREQILEPPVAPAGWGPDGSLATAPSGAAA